MCSGTDIFLLLASQQKVKNRPDRAYEDNNESPYDLVPIDSARLSANEIKERDSDQEKLKHDERNYQAEYCSSGNVRDFKYLLTSDGTEPTTYLLAR
jgi:hypothetical protein